MGGKKGALDELGMFYCRKSVCLDIQWPCLYFKKGKSDSTIAILGYPWKFFLIGMARGYRIYLNYRSGVHSIVI